MSGGFFRGTSADQDTRFSNKQAKLLKSQKFAPELEHLVDMTKVNMEVMRPWITRKVTELLGFEDEVLINFIHGLLDAKKVNGKEVQIQITGFMEKNTGKFMKELWTLLLSAQKNATGVPQQFLDAKEEELLKKKAENDRISSEIQRKKDKESKEIMEERLKKLDGGLDAKDNDTASDPTLKLRDSGNYIQDGKETDKRNGVRLRGRSSHSPAVSTSPHRGSPSRANSKSFSNSRSYSRSISRSPKVRGRSVSSERIQRSSRRQSISPRRRSPQRSPLRRPSYSRRRSRSRSGSKSASTIRRGVHSPFRRRRSPSPVRRRRSPSPVRRRKSPSPVRRRRSPPSPVRRRRSPPSPVRRRRSPPSPVRRRRSPPSPVRRRRSPYPARRRRSPSPVQRRRSPSPVQRRRSPSPVRQLRSPSPMHLRRSPLPIRRRSPSPIQQRSPNMRRRSPSPIPRRPPSRGQRSSSPMHSPVMQRHDSLIPRRRSPSPLRYRSPVSGKKRPTSASPKSSPQDDWSSPSPVRVSPSPVKRTLPRDQRSPLQSSMGRVRVQKKLSPEVYQSSSPLRSIQTDKNGKASGYKSQDSMSTPDKSPVRSISPQAVSKTSSKSRSTHEIRLRPTREKLINEGSLSPPKKPTNHKPSHDIPQTSEGTEEACNSRELRDPKSNSSEKKSRHSPVSKRIGSPEKFNVEDEFNPERAASHLASEYNHYDSNERSKKDQDIKCDKSSGKGGESPGQQKSSMSKEFFSSKKPHDSYGAEIKKPDDRDQSNSKYAKSSDQHHEPEVTQELVGKADHVNQSAYDSEESGKHRRDGKDKRKHKRSEKKADASDENDSYDSELEDRKEAKRRKKEEKKKLRKEEKHRKREERRRKREERHAGKLKMKSKTDTISEDEEAERMDVHQSDDEAPYDPKKLEIELRNKALETLKAKRGMNN